MTVCTLTHVLGSVPVIKMLNFLMDHQGHDYTKAEIALNAEVRQTDMKRDFHCLLDSGMIVGTRKIGGVQLYELNEDDRILDALFNLIGTIGHVSSEIVEREAVAALIEGDGEAVL